MSSFKERTDKNLQLSCDNSDSKEARFTRTETDFSNLFARGKRAHLYRILPPKKRMDKNFSLELFVPICPSIIIFFGNNEENSGQRTLNCILYGSTFLTGDILTGKHRCNF